MEKNKDRFNEKEKGINLYLTQTVLRFENLFWLEITCKWKLLFFMLFVVILRGGRGGRIYFFSHDEILLKL